MADPVNRGETRKPFLDAREAEVVHGPEVIAGEVSEALRDADRFGLDGVKPPLAEALREARRAGVPDGETPEQDALSGVHAEVDGGAGSAEKLKPDDASSPA